MHLRHCGFLAGKHFMLLLFVCLLAACSTAPSKEEVNKAVKKVMPVDFEVLSVKPLREVPGLNEVVVRFNKQVSVVYADRKGKFLVIGSVMEAATARNLTLETQRKFSQQ